jgi:hypothetical protein
MVVSLRGVVCKVTYSSPVSSACDSRDSMPERNCSRDREICASWALGERLSDMARWRSSSESLMWSDKRNNCGGLVAIATTEAGGIMVVVVVPVFMRSSSVRVAGAEEL